MKPKLGVVACGDSGDIFSVLTSGRYDHRLLKKHIWEDNQNGGQTIFYLSSSLDHSSYSLNDEMSIVSNVRLQNLIPNF